MFSRRENAAISTLEIPINTALLNTVNNQLVQHGQFVRSVTIARPRGKDFNEDLKAEHLRQIKRPILIIKLAKGQILYRAKTEAEALEYIEKDLKKRVKLETMQIGTELRILKTKPNQLIPVLQGQLLFTANGIEKSFTDSFLTQANTIKQVPKLNNEQSL